jgi:hypothetical protein
VLRKGTSHRTAAQISTRNALSTRKTSGIISAPIIPYHGTALSKPLPRHSVPGYDHTVSPGQNIFSDPSL